MERGYLKMWRKSLDCEIFHNPELWRLWSWCLMKTSYKPRFMPFQTGKGKLSVKVEAGQFIFGRNKAAEFLGDSPSTVWKRMKKLELLRNITIQSNKQYSIITICNWEEYQEDDKTEVTSKEQASDKQVTTEEQLSDTNKKVKKDKNKEKTIVGQKPRQQIPFSEIVSFLNETIGKDYKASTKETRGHIQARFNDGFTIDDFKTVIKHKNNEWANDPQMCQYLRPKTLFGTNFESYLQSAKETNQPKSIWVKNDKLSTTIPN